MKQTKSGWTRGKKRTTRLSPRETARCAFTGERRASGLWGRQARRDEEIAAIQKHSRHQPPAIQKPPELPPAPPRKALMIVGVLLLVLLLAGGLTLLEHVSHDRALAKETERETIPTVALFIRRRKNPTKNWCCPVLCWLMKNLRFMPAPAGILCAGTKTLAAA